MRPRLLVSLSGIGRANLADCAAFAAALDRRGVPLSLLLTPKPNSERPTRDSPVLDWIRTRERAGDALVLHGFDHVAQPSGHRLPLPRLAPAASWAGGRIWRRAEFAELPAHEAGLRLLAATAVLDRLELRTKCFAPPSWLASAGTMVALRRRGFEVCADATGVHDLRTGASHRGRVHQVGRGELWARAALRGGRRGGLVRIAVDAAELSRPQPARAVLGAISGVLRLGALGGTYADLGLGRTAERRGLNAG
ncbi:DUF2334 domain-containing protein [Crossiella sp. SN42]|uniref:DUF2334 domain-containing protein n=1 Tax=Crossiella sp. SN42 TaxID=2944808 RepID=UPI00207C2C33|nr:DUF2334 domain-containing protein [Crossiella sp. SN42]MCO1579686.1 DUF2334 domain-containing protein [Crossiella sp. SN42]